MPRVILPLPSLLGIVFVALAIFGFASAAEPPAEPNGKVQKLFDGKTLAGWKSTEFGGEGEVSVVDGAIVLEMGNNMTGITWTDAAKLPTIDYELTLEAKRIDGDDFFCGLTFPVRDKALSLILGGWGGATVGLSSIDDADASSNETTSYVDFDRDHWYKVRLRVTDAKVQAWLDGKSIVDVKIAGRKLSVRSEVELSRPLGISTWLTKAAIRNVELRPIVGETK
ncbi:MAG: DUF1080 domain-containing protein [Pirellula sp.]|nr:DUF1080 domain-containing protein [Pirellula sp.]